MRSGFIRNRRRSSGKACIDPRSQKRDLGHPATMMITSPDSTEVERGDNDEVDCICLLLWNSVERLSRSARRPDHPRQRVGSLVVGHTKANDVGTNGSVSDKYNDQGLGISFDQNMRIDAVHVTRPNYKTKEGLTVGDAEKAIVAAYGKGEIVSIPIMAGNEKKATYSNHAMHYPGIRWVIGEGDKVTSIFLSAE